MHSNKKIQFMRAVVCVAAAVCIIAGIRGGEVSIVFNKAINICFECIGLG